MSFLVHDAQAKSLTFSDDSFSIFLMDGRVLTVPLAYFPRLLSATFDQLMKYELSGGGTGIHWEALNEDISVAGLLAGRGDQTKRPQPHHPKTA